MNKLHDKVHSQHSAKLGSLAERSTCGRVFNLFILIFILNTGLYTPAQASDTQRTRAQAIEIAKSRSGDGRVLSVKKRVNKNGDSVFAVKIIVNGRVKVYSIREFAN